LNESNTRARFITPALERAGWDPLSQIHHEFPLRAGRVHVRGRRAMRDRQTVLSADYALFNNLKGKSLLGLDIPLPPMAEQSRIVTRVNELKALCAELRVRLTASQLAQSHLADTWVTQ
jgi:hypothetical protein